MLSPISRNDKPTFSVGHPKEPNWVPGKYSDPKCRKFNLDLNKVGLGNSEAKTDKEKEFQSDDQKDQVLTNPLKKVYLTGQSIEASEKVVGQTEENG